MGVPLIVGDTGGLAEFVTDERGRRCRPGDPQDLAARILEVLSDTALTHQRRDAARAALTDYSWPSIAERTLLVYEQATRTRRPARRTRAPGNPIGV